MIESCAANSAYFGNCPASVVVAHPNALKRTQWQATLQCFGYKVVAVASTTEVIGAITSGLADIILIAFDSPEVGAAEFCQRLKSAPSTQFLPVFVIAESDEAELEVRAIEAGADAYLLEPLRAEPLHARIQASLRRRSIIESLDDSETVLVSLARSVEERDPSLGQHCERLAQLCSALGAAVGLSAQEIVTLQRAGYLHDIGKVAIPDQILFKQGPLSPNEWAIMESHAERGERICSNIRSLSSVLPVIRHHHEKWNGTGYPDRLKGEEIPLLARILQMADIYDALTTERPYKRAFSPEEAIQIMRDEAAKGWRDPALTAQFAELLPQFQVSTTADSGSLALAALVKHLGAAHHAERIVPARQACKV